MFYRVIYQRKETPQDGNELSGLNPEDALSFFDEKPEDILTAVLECKQEKEKAEFQKVGEIECVGPNVKVETTDKTVLTFRCNILKSMLERRINWKSIQSFVLKAENVAT